jgi:hypothetical protein
MKFNSPNLSLQVDLQECVGSERARNCQILNIVDPSMGNMEKRVGAVSFFDGELNSLKHSGFYAIIMLRQWLSKYHLSLSFGKRLNG